MMNSAGSQPTLDQVVEALRSNDDFVICGHVSPDGDCLGSGLALMYALRAMGKTARCVLAKNDVVDYSLRWLPGLDDMVPIGHLTGSFETFVMVDVPGVDRLGQDGAEAQAKAAHTIVIDHHPAGQVDADIHYSDVHSPAASLIVWQIINMLNIPITEDMAVCCYTGLMTDTGRFQFQNTNAECFKSAAQMIDAGADVSSIARDVFQNRSRASLSLEGLALDRMVFTEDGSCVYSYLLANDFESLGAIKADAEPIINSLRGIRGVRIACILREQDGVVRGSLRAKDDTDVAAIASQIGGGGHKAAAGFTFKGSMEDAIDCICGHFQTIIQG